MLIQTDVTWPLLNITDTVSCRGRRWLLDCSPRQNVDKFLEKLLRLEGIQRALQDRDLKKPYELSLALFHVLEETHHMQNTDRLTDLVKQERCL